MCSAGVGKEGEKAMNRRRFLTISAAGLGALAVGKAQGRAIKWQGAAFGADASITLYGDPEKADAVLDMISVEIRAMERAFSLYDPSSEIRKLNRLGYLQEPSSEFLKLLEISNYVRQNTQGRFDPTVQPLWQGHQGATIGLPYLEVKAHELRFSKPQMALTLNGIAQGFATDRISEILMHAGYQKTLVNIGEYRANHGRFVLAIENQLGQNLRNIGLKDGAIATSAPFASHNIGQRTHIYDPRQKMRPLWRTISVIADSAALADGFSTAFCFANKSEIEFLLTQEIGSREVLMETPDGKLHRLQA